MSQYQAVYRDGTILNNLSYEESLDIFEEARDTDNPCNLRPMDFCSDNIGK